MRECEPDVITVQALANELDVDVIEVEAHVNSLIALDGRDAVIAAEHALTVNAAETIRMSFVAFGMLTDYVTGMALRPATRQELCTSRVAGETGAFMSEDFHCTVYVSGGVE